MGIDDESVVRGGRGDDAGHGSEDAAAPGDEGSAATRTVATPPSPPAPIQRVTVIPRRLIRTVPVETTDEVEKFWQDACDLHPDWEHVTLRDPVDRSLFPLTSHLWDTCESGAQLADLIRAEELALRGGVYIDSDVEVYRSFEPLLGLRGFAAWDCVDYIPNAIMGFQTAHPAIGQVVQLAIDRHDQGTWAAGVGVTTDVFKGRNDMVLFPPGSFYPVFWKRRNEVDWDKVQQQNPWAYCAHHAHHSWANAGKK